ncbi:MAG: DRTGG domain-containing protein [Spirochaetota bacterium]|nr:DRTGG domain-containing protein [Spirochaetota bacterium]
MKLQELIEKLDLTVLTKLEERNVEGAFITDMLSDLMASAKAGNIWLTVQTHKNIISAANLLDISAILISSGKTVPQETIDLANRFHVIILSSTRSTFELAGKLIEVGLKP